MKTDQSKNKLKIDKKVIATLSLSEQRLIKGGQQEQLTNPGSTVPTILQSMVNCNTSDVMPCAQEAVLA